MFDRGIDLGCTTHNWPFLSCYGSVLDAGTMRAAVAVQRRLPAHEAALCAVQIPFCVRQFPYLCHGAHGVQLVWPRASSGAACLCVPIASPVRYAEAMRLAAVERQGLTALEALWWATYSPLAGVVVRDLHSIPPRAVANKALPLATNGAGTWYAGNVREDAVWQRWQAASIAVCCRV